MTNLDETMSIVLGILVPIAFTFLGIMIGLEL